MTGLGWEWTECGFSDQLQEFSVIVMDHEECKDMLLDFITEEFTKVDNLICTNNTKGMEYPFHPVYGGPLIVNSELVGIVSPSIFKNPTIYTNISVHLDFLESVLW